MTTVALRTPKNSFIPFMPPIPLVLFVLFAPIRLVVVVGKAFRFRESAMSDDACLQVRNYRIDFAGGECSRRWIEISARLSVAGPRGIGGFVERGHPGPRAPPTDRQLERARVEPRGAQIRACRCFVALLFAVRESAVAIGASAPSLERQSGFRLVFILRKGSTRPCDCRRREDDESGAGAQATLLANIR
jgi:hypothetical protein